MSFEALAGLLAQMLPNVDPITRTLMVVLGLSLSCWSLYRHVRRLDDSAFDARMAQADGIRASAVAELRAQLDDIKRECQECEVATRAMQLKLVDMFNLFNQRTDQRNTARLYWTIYADALGKPAPVFAPDPPGPHL